MYWVKDVDGDLINLAVIDSIVCESGTLIARRWYGTETATVYTLYCGSPEELGKRRDELFERLTRHQEHVHVVE